MRRSRTTFPAAPAVIASMVLAGEVDAGQVQAEVSEATAEGSGEFVGKIHFVDSPHGLLIEPDLRLTSSGPHGLHVHQNPSCDPIEMDGRMDAAGAAGGHFDPADTGRHAGPYNDGHLGDLPNLHVEADGSATIPLLAPRVSAADLESRAIIVHSVADRYDDHGTHRHGSGGQRVYCGVVASVDEAGAP